MPEILKDDPSGTPASYDSYFPTLIQTILKAGTAILGVKNKGFEVFEKTDTSPVTVADQLGEDIITKALIDLAPHIPVVGEEAKEAGKAPDITGGLFWLVDPLDGTKEFIRGGDDFTVNIGLIKDGKPILGLVYAPANGRLWGGSLSAGAFACTVSGAASDTPEIGDKETIKVRTAKPDALTIVASRSHRSEELENWLAHFPSAENISIGSSLKLVLVAEGKADLYPRLGPTCEWDTAAAHAVLLSAGGIVYAPDGRELTYGKNLKTFLNPYFLCVGDQSLKTPPLTTVAS